MINYYLLMKPGILMGNLITFTAGFLLASKGGMDLYFWSLTGLAAIIASACIFNNLFDRSIDAKMERTKNRPSVTRGVGIAKSIVLASLLFLAGNFVLLTFTNPLALILANIGFGIYIFLYTFLKTSTTHATLIGSFAGAVPPVVGYCSVSQELDMGAGLLFLMMLFWQMPHFFAIALYRLEDYSKAGIPVLPLSRGIMRTKIEISLYILAFLPVLSSLTLSGYTSPLFFVVTLLMGLGWLLLGIQGFSIEDHAQWGKKMFRYSLLMINAVCLIICFEFFFYW